MTDYFRLLNETRRPWLDAARLRQKFLGLAAEFHPDRTHNAPDAEKSAAHQHYAALNAAYNCLAEPKSRVLHLLELERGGKPADIQTIPPALADLFASIAGVCREADTFLLNREKVSSPLLKIQWFERAQDWIESLKVWQKKLGDFRSNLDARLEELDGDWMKTSHDVGQKNAILFRLEELYRLFGYFNRWQSQLQERVDRLSF